MVNKLKHVLLIAAAALVLGACSNLISVIHLNVEDGQNMITGQTVLIDYQTKPIQTRIDPNAVQISGGESWIEDGKLKFQAMKPGTYTISVTQNGVTSNTVTVDIKASPLADASSSHDDSKDSSAQDQSSENSSSSSEDDPLADAKATVQDHIISVDQAWEDADSLAGSGKLITVDGKLPQSTIQDKAGNNVVVMWNSDISKYIILEGFPIPFGNCDANVTGRLRRNDNGELVMDMTYVEATNMEPSATPAQ